RATRGSGSVTREATIAIFPGDGIGPEVTAEAVAVLDLVVPRHDVALSFSTGTIGGAAIDATRQPLPSVALARARSADPGLLGAVGGPQWDEPKATGRPDPALPRLPQG